MSKKTTQLNEKKQSLYNGHLIQWCIGDLNFNIAEKLGMTEIYTDEQGLKCRKLKTTKGYAWEAWGYFNNKPYQLSAMYCSDTNTITNILVNNDQNNFYYDKYTAELLLTKV